MRDKRVYSRSTQAPTNKCGLKTVCKNWKYRKLSYQNDYIVTQYLIFWVNGRWIARGVDHHSNHVASSGLPSKRIPYSNQGFTNGRSWWRRHHAVHEQLHTVRHRYSQYNVSCLHHHFMGPKLIMNRMYLSLIEDPICGFGPTRWGLLPRFSISFKVDWITVK